MTKTNRMSLTPIAAAMTALFLAAAALPASAQIPMGGEGPFGGAYAGIEAGMSNMDISNDLGNVGAGESMYGGFLGWRYQSPDGIVAGVEARLHDSSVADVTDAAWTTPSEPRITEARLGRSFGLEAMLGMTLGDARRYLVFASGGYLNQKVSGRRIDADSTLAPRPTVAFSDKEGGFRIGGGVEMAFGSNFSLRGTAHHSDAGPVKQFQLLASGILRF